MNKTPRFFHYFAVATKNYRQLRIRLDFSCIWFSVYRFFHVLQSLFFWRDHNQTFSGCFLLRTLNDPYLEPNRSRSIINQKSIYFSSLPMKHVAEIQTRSDCHSFLIEAERLISKIS